MAGAARSILQRNVTGLSLVGANGRRPSPTLAVRSCDGPGGGCVRAKSVHLEATTSLVPEWPATSEPLPRSLRAVGARSPDGERRAAAGAAVDRAGEGHRAIAEKPRVVARRETGRFSSSRGGSAISTAPRRRATPAPTASGPKAANRHGRSRHRGADVRGSQRAGSRCSISAATAAACGAAAEVPQKCHDVGERARRRRSCARSRWRHVGLVDHLGDPAVAAGCAVDRAEVVGHRALRGIRLGLPGRRVAEVAL